MKALLCWTLAVVVALSGLSRAQSAEKKDAGPGSAREKLVGAWRLAWMEEQGEFYKEIAIAAESFARAVVFPPKQIFGLSVLKFPSSVATHDGRESQTISRSTASYR